MSATDETPRTDACLVYPAKRYDELADFSRCLERENAELRKELAFEKEAYEAFKTNINNTVNELRAERNDLKAALTEARGGTYPQPRRGWQCFHCGEWFTTEEAARSHFGATPDEVKELRAQFAALADEAETHLKRANQEQGRRIAAESALAAATRPVGDVSKLRYDLFNWCNKDFTGVDIVEDAQELLCGVATILERLARERDEWKDCAEKYQREFVLKCERLGEIEERAESAERALEEDRSESLAATYKRDSSSASVSSGPSPSDVREAAALADDIEHEGIERVVYAKDISTMAAINRLLIAALRSMPLPPAPY